MCENRLRQKFVVCNYGFVISPASLATVFIVDFDVINMQ